MGICTVTATFVDLNGTAVPNVRLSISPAPNGSLVALDVGVAVPRPIEVNANGSGVATFGLEPGVYSYVGTHAAGPFSGTFPVPDLPSATFEALLSTPIPPFEVVSWVAFQTLIAAAATPFASPAAALAATPEGGAFVAVSGDQIVAARRVSGQLVMLYPEVI